MAFFVVNAVSTLLLCGLIWVVQVCHYPLFSLVDASGFARYERAHQKKISYVVVPLMTAELATSLILIVSVPAFLGPAMAWLNFSLVAVVWLSTFLVQVPCHCMLNVYAIFRILNSSKFASMRHVPAEASTSGSAEISEAGSLPVPDSLEKPVLVQAPRSAVREGNAIAKRYGFRTMGQPPGKRLMRRNRSRPGTPSFAEVQLNKGLGRPSLLQIIRLAMGKVKVRRAPRRRGLSVLSLKKCAII